MNKVIYLTGSPASGKTTTLRLLNIVSPSVMVFEYGQEMTKYLYKRKLSSTSQHDIRSGTDGKVSYNDIREVNEILIEWCKINRNNNSLVIDTHQVTRESYGYNLTPFTIDNLKQLGLSEIWFFYANSEQIISRIENAPEGRPLPTVWNADFHTFSQLSIAETYSVLSGVPIYMFDTHVDQQELVTRLVERLK